MFQGDHTLPVEACSFSPESESAGVDQKRPDRRERRSGPA